MVDNLIKLFDTEETEFETNGLGVLPDAETCEITEERNGEFELEMDYPINGRHYSDIGLRKIIVAKSNPYSKPQPFRIYSISKPIDGIVTINAEHISYDLSGYPVSAFSLEEPNTTIQNVFDEFKNQSVRECPFTFWTNKIATGKFSLPNPRSIRSLLAGSEGSIVDIYGAAEYEFDNYSVKLWMSRGEDKGVTIRYGKNLTDLEQEENCSSVYTAIYPYWYSETDNILITLHESDVEDASEKDDEGNVVTVHIPDKIVKVEGTFAFERIYTLDMSDKFTEKPTELELYKATKKYAKDNDIGVPKVSIEVSFEPLSKTSDYKDYAILEEIRLCDTVYVEFPELGVSATAKCVKTVYDVLSDKYKKIELGSIKNNLANSLSEQSKTLANTTSKTYVDNLLDETVMAISGNSGGYVVIHSSKGGKHPDEILIMDEPELENAKRIWRWNMSGLCYTNNSYDSFADNDKNNKGVAITMDGKIVADFIAGNMIQGVGLQTAPDPNGDVWFEVTQDGTLTARKGIIGGCEIQNGVLQIKNANIEEVLTGHTFKASVIEGSKFVSTPVEVINDNGKKETKSLFEVTKEGQVYIRAEAIVNKLKVSQLEANKFVLSGQAYGLGSLSDIGSNEDAENAFRLNNSTGLLEARNALIRGTIYANTGEIAGLKMFMEQADFTSNETSKVIRASDPDNNAAFEVRVSKAGSSVTVLDLAGARGYFNDFVSTNAIYAGIVKISGRFLYANNERVISFESVVPGSEVTATIYNSSTSNKITIKLTDYSGSPYKLKNPKTFYFRIHYTWGNWSDTKSLTIGVNSSEITREFTGTFWGYDDAQFTANGLKDLDFTDSNAVYLDFMRHISPYENGEYDIGLDSRRWRSLYVSTVHSAITYTDSGNVYKSDRNAKKDILELNEAYELLFDELKPVSYKFIENSNERTHVGFIAQEVNDAIDKAGLTAKDFAAYCEIVKDDGLKTYGLRYGEFVALNTHEIQKLKKRVSELENRLTS